MTLWKTKDGRELQIKDMSDSHIINTILILERRKVKFAKAIEDPKMYTSVRAFQKLTFQYYRFIREAAKRGLTSNLNFARLLK